jgi:type I restriction enzyme R subunit
MSKQPGSVDKPIDKKQLSETDIIRLYIMPAVLKAGWNPMLQIRQEVKLKDGKVIVRGNLGVRQNAKFADIVLYHKPSMALAVIEAKANKFSVDKGLQQALDYGQMLEVPFIFSSNGDSFTFHDKTNPERLETQVSLDDFPSPEQLWQKFSDYKGYTPAQLPLVTQDYHDDGSGKSPRYYQLKAINKTIEAISKGQNRNLLVMATGTGKTYTAFQIIWRLYKAGVKKRILFLADRNILVDQTKTNDFAPFGAAMTKIKGRKVDPAYEIHLGLYQALTGPEEHQKAFKQVSADYFDLIVIDECHRGSAADDSAWREILEYFSSATQIGLTATPKETDEVSNIDYFGEPVYTYSLKEGIEDGFLAPYKVVRVDIDVDGQGWRPSKGQIDKKNQVIDDRIYNQKDFDRSLIIDERTQLVAQTITAYLKRTDPMAKTIVFCNDIDHADRMRKALVNLNPEQVLKNEKYVMKITGDDKIGKAELDNFINPKKAYPVIATTSELMSTGVDAKTCKLVVLDQTINSMTKFKQVIGRGTRIDERYGKLWFTILDFKKATELFADERFDGTPEKVIKTDPNGIIDTSDDDFDDILNGDNPGDESYGTDDPFDPFDDPQGISEPTAGDYTVDGGDDSDNEPGKAVKYHVDGVVVTKVAERVQYYDTDGKLVTESFKDYTRNTIHKQFDSLDAFVKRWQQADKKQVFIDELAEMGVIWQALEQDIGKDLDPFDLICHVAYDQPPLTRKERANSVKKRNYFAKYSDTARTVLTTLLDKYADEGIQEIESVNVLKIKPLNQLGSPAEIAKKAFGGKKQYQQAIVELEEYLYTESTKSA